MCSKAIVINICSKIAFLEDIAWCFACHSFILVINVMCYCVKYVICMTLSYYHAKTSNILKNQLNLSNFFSSLRYCRLAEVAILKQTGFKR